MLLRSVFYLIISQIYLYTPVSLNIFVIYMLYYIRTPKVGIMLFYTINY